MIFGNKFANIAFVVLHLQLEYTIGSDFSHVSYHESRCSHHSRINMRSHLEKILLQIEHPGSILMLTDCVNGLGHGRDVLLFSYVSFAFMSPVKLNETKREMLTESKLFIVVDLPEKQSGKAAQMVLETYQSLNHLQHKKWQPTTLIILEMTDVKKEMIALQTISQEITLNFDSNIFAIFLNLLGQISTNETAVWEMYSIKKKRMISKLGSISLNSLIPIDGKKCSVLSLESYAKRRRNFQLETFTASVKYDPNFEDWIGIEEKDDGSFHLKEGYVAFLYRDLQMLMNFSENVTKGDSPYILPDGALGGITVHQLNSGEIDISLNQISFSLHRARALTFLHPTYFSFIHAFFKQPPQNTMRNIVIATFQKRLWITLIGMWMLLVMSVNIRPMLQRKNHSSRFSRSLGSIKDKKFIRESLLWSVASICQKTWYLDPYSTSLRMKFMIGSFVSFMSYTAYSAAICSSLAVAHVPVKNFIDLISFNFIFTVHERSEPFQTMLRGMIQSYNLSQDVATVSTMKEISHLYSKSSTIASDIRSTSKAFLSPADMFYKTAALLDYSDSFICDHITTMYASSYPTKSAMLVQKNSQFKEVLNHMLAYLSGRGLLSRNIQGYNTKNFLKCLPIDQQDNKIAPADYADIFTIVLVLIVGMPVAIFILLMEMLYGASINGGRLFNGRDQVESVYYDKIVKNTLFYIK